MSAYRLHLDAGGFVCGGECIDHTRSSETWRLTAFPVKSPEECGFVIAWPDGVPFGHEHYVGAIDAPADHVAGVGNMVDGQERAA